jgi:hypothetical protein
VPKKADRKKADSKAGHTQADSKAGYTQADSKAGHTQDGEGGFSKHFISLTLPLLSLHWALLPTIKSSFERNKDDYIKAIGNFVWFQMHALGMTLDPTRKLRSHLDDDLENKLRTELTQMLDLWAARVVTLVEIQEVILPRLVKRLNDIKNEERGDIKDKERAER